MNRKRGSIFAVPGGRTAKWVVFVLWILVIVISTGPAQLTTKFSDAEQNESTSFLPGDAESTKALTAAEELQGGELAPAVIVYRRESGLTAADRAQIQEDAARLTKKRFPSVVADGPTAAAGGQGGDSESGGPSPPAGGEAPSGGAGGEGCAGPLTALPGQPEGYRPFVGPICSEDGKAAIVTAYLRGDGESESLLDPMEFWRDTVSDPGGGLEVKITGGAGYAADAIEVFTSLNGTLLLAAVTLVILLLIAIYRSPIFLFIPLVSVIFAETLSRSVGYGISELGVTINGQSSSIMSILVLGAGTDYALLVVARYREELHKTTDPHVAMRAAMISAGPAVFASAATVVAALFCLTLAKVDGTAGLGPIGAMGVACAAFSMLTLLPAMLVIFGRRAFWPFVPHTPETAPTDEVAGSNFARGIADGGKARALLPVIGAGLLAFLLLPLTIVTALIRRFVSLVSGARVKVPSVVSLLDNKVFKPYELRRFRHEKAVDATHGFWKRVGDRVGAAPKRVAIGSVAILLVLSAGLVFFSTDLTTNDSYTTEVESTEGQDLVAASFPAGASVPTDVIVPPGGDVAAVTEAVEGTDGVEAVGPPVAEGEQGTLVQATLEPNPYSTDAFDLIEPIRESASGAQDGTLVGGASAIEFDVRDAAGTDSKVIPPIVLVVVFIILMILLRAVIAPLVLMGTVILSYAAALGVGYLFFDLVFGFPGSDPSLPLFAFVFLVALGVDYNIFLVARAREETPEHGTREGILRALAVTGGVITSAGIVLAGTFTVLGVLPLVFLAEIGFVVAFGVLLDTFLVRSVLVPALIVLIGPKVWWPSKLAKNDGGGVSVPPAAPEAQPAR
ncbi:MAG: MMPL family transporter [Thermoleophilaceae bacterium]|nr:MMPL family transporter [Thermoleophilaceae bacterium]